MEIVKRGQIRQLPELAPARVHQVRGSDSTPQYTEYFILETGTFMLNVGLALTC